MTRDLTQALTKWLEAGFGQMGQVLITRTEAGFELRHSDDDGRSDLESFPDPDAARALSLYTDAGEFRPLKTAPNLRRGWRLLVKDAAALRRALDHFYPSMCGVLLAHQLGALEVTPLRSTLGRQTGMYAVTRKITDEQAQELIGGFCTSQGGCLKTILWRMSEETCVRSLPLEKFDPEVNQAGGPRRALPMLCHEACNLLVAEARKVVKKTPAAE